MRSRSTGVEHTGKGAVHTYGDIEKSLVYKITRGAAVASGEGESTRGTHQQLSTTSSVLEKGAVHTYGHMEKSSENRITRGAATG